MNFINILFEEHFDNEAEADTGFQVTGPKLNKRPSEASKNILEVDKSRCHAKIFFFFNIRSACTPVHPYEFAPV